MDRGNKADIKEGTNGSRHYRSKTGSDYIEPTHHSRGDFSGWIKVSGGKDIPLAQARYVDLATAKRILSIYGRDAEAIKQVYDPAKIIDHDNVRGIVLYTLPGMEGTLQPSQIIEFIRPDIPIRAKREFSGIEQALKSPTSEDSGLDIVPGTSRHDDTEVISTADILEEIAQSEKDKKNKKPVQKSGK
ncbi:MAG: hypothetical protein WCP89_03645 [archaeon]